jgi:hypothetical protein
VVTVELVGDVRPARVNERKIEELTWFNPSNDGEQSPTNELRENDNAKYPS